MDAIKRVESLTMHPLSAPHMQDLMHILRNPLVVECEYETKVISSRRTYLYGFRRCRIRLFLNMLPKFDVRLLHI